MGQLDPPGGHAPQGERSSSAGLPLPPQPGARRRAGAVVDGWHAVWTVHPAWQLPGRFAMDRATRQPQITCQRAAEPGGATRGDARSQARPAGPRPRVDAEMPGLRVARDGRGRCSRAGDVVLAMPTVLAQLAPDAHPRHRAWPARVGSRQLSRILPQPPPTLLCRKARATPATVEAPPLDGLP